jgi:hypothetical protein
MRPACARDVGRAKRKVQPRPASHGADAHARRTARNHEHTPVNILHLHPRRPVATMRAHMNSLSKLLPLLCLALVGFLAVAATTNAPAARKKGRNHLRHVVAFKFKSTASKEDIAKLDEAFRALRQKIPQVLDLEAGTNNSPEGFNKGFTHMWILTFSSEANRDAYLKHPDHQAFGSLVKPIVDDVFVLDFWAKE